MKYLNSFILFSFLILATLSCNHSMTNLHPYLETMPVYSKGDAADDVAIFTDLKNEFPLFIIATDKQSGLVVYDMNGNIQRADTSGHINNVDLRKLSKDKVLIGCSNRTINAMQFFNFKYTEPFLIPIPTNLPKTSIEEVYGFCLYQNDLNIYAYVVGKEGLLEGYELNWEDDSLKAIKIYNHSFSTQCEGLVADDANGKLYIAEEDLGVWMLDLNHLEAKPELIISLKNNAFLKKDLEGVALYEWNNEVYLLVSSQGNNSFAVFNTNKNFEYIGSFNIGKNKNIDRTTETDGLDISKGVHGILVVQDGKNTKNGVYKQNQNFKLVKNIDLIKFLKNE